MKHSDFKEKLNALLPNILMLVSETDKNLRNTLIIYTLVGNPLGKQQFLELIASLPPFPNKASIMDTLEQFIEEGKQEATRVAVQNLIKQSVLTDEQIASAMNVTIHYVLEIRKAL